MYSDEDTMYYKLILTLLVFCALPVAAQRNVTVRTPIYNSYGNFYEQNPRAFRHYNNYQHYSRGYMSNENLSDMNALEKYTFNRNYSRENNLSRLQRLEMQAFGAIQDGDINSRYRNVRSAILARPKQNPKASLLRNISDYFSGQMTGFTPQIYRQNCDNYDNSNFSNQSFQSYSTPWSSGYRMNNSSSGSGIGIKILD